MKSNEFQVFYEVNSGLIRAVAAGSGSVNGNNINWGSNVTISSVSYYTQDVNEKTGFANTIKQEIDFKIPCENDLQAGKIASNISSAFLNKQVLNLTGFLPQYNNGSFVVRVTNPLSDFEKISDKLKK